MSINTQYGASVSSKKIRIKNPKELKCALVTQNFKRGIWHLKLESAIIALFFFLCFERASQSFQISESAKVLSFLKITQSLHLLHCA